LAYSCISLADVAARLHIPSVDDTECIVAKAIRDGAIDAIIDHDKGTLVSRDTQVCVCVCGHV
jgi:26S proteasome regulatory subunit N3